MRIVLFYHSLVSDWNHGNAHFLRGLAGELRGRGHEVVIYEPAQGWSASNLLQEKGPGAFEEFAAIYPELHSCFYKDLDLDTALAGADLVIVHEWTERGLVEALGAHHARRENYVLLFHDTHHRQLTAPESVGRLDGYDGVLAFGETLRRHYLAHGLARRAWTWHEAADVRMFYPRNRAGFEGDLVWIGNWGDDERTAELEEFLFGPVAALGLKTVVYGVRYPKKALERLARAGIEYRGWLANFRVPEVFSRFRMTVHVPRRPYSKMLPGIPTIRVFEALACGIPLVCAPWEDSEGLFVPGCDFLVAHSGREMRCALRWLEDEQQAGLLAESGLQRIRQRHTCRHRVEELMGIVETVKADKTRTWGNTTVWR